MTVTRVAGSDNQETARCPTCPGKDVPVLPNNHGPQTDRLIYSLGPFKGYDSGDPISREVGLYDQTFVDSFIQPLSNGGRIIAGQFDDPYQLDEKGIFDLVNLGRTISAASPARAARRAKTSSPASTSSRSRSKFLSADVFPAAFRITAKARNSTDSLLRVWASISRQQTQTVDSNNIITGLSGSGRLGAGRPERASAL